MRSMPSPDPICPLCGRPAILIYQRIFRDRKWSMARCPCGLRFTHPPPTLDEIVSFYRTDYHGALTHGADQNFLAKFSGYADIIARHVSGGRSLDVGCTTGLLPHLLRQRGFDAEGLEVNPRTAAWGTQTYGVPIAVGTFEEYCGAPGKLNVLSMTDVVEHTLDPMATLRKANTLLRPGGSALISFPDITSAKSRYYQMLARVLGRDWLWNTCHIPQHTWEFTRPVAVRCFAAAGFSLTWFGRTDGPDNDFSGRLGVLSWPVRPLNLRPLAKLLGTGMIFLLRKEREPA
jgi:2-polyprenyl-3-methyl-5-hydroxy-6-metoxy-1,4-benzoquinol methylase